MSVAIGWVARMRSLISRREADDRMREEFAFHIAMETARLEREGFTIAEASRRARVAFGSSESHKESMRDARRLPFFEDAMLDARYAARAICRAPSYTLTIVAFLGIAIALNTGVFSILNSLTMGDLPGITQRSRIVSVHQFVVPVQGAGEFRGFDEHSLEVLQKGLRTLTAVAGYSSSTPIVRFAGAARRVNAELVSAEYFRVLGTRFALGTGFVVGNARANEQSAVISYRLWQEEFRADRSVLNHAITVDGSSYHIVGVAPEYFAGAHLGDAALSASARRDLWLAFDSRRDADRQLGIVGRLASTANDDDVRREAQRIAPLLQSDSARSVSLRISPFGLAPGEQSWLPVFGFMAVPVLVLIIACANAANLLLARATTREREISVRIAMGAARGRIVRQLFTESALLALLSSTVGVALSLYAMKVAQSFGLGVPSRADIDWRVMGFICGVTVVTALAFGLMPALRGSHVLPMYTLRASGVSSSRRSARLRALLVSAQVALSLVLLVSCALFVRSVQKGSSFDYGLKVDELAILQFESDDLLLPPAKREAFATTALAQLAGISGVQSVAMSSTLPFESGTERRVFAAGTRQTSSFAAVTIVDGDYFGATGLTVRRGRTTDAVRRELPGRAAVVSDSLAERLWPGGNPIGETLQIGEDSTRQTVVVVGTVRDVRVRADGTPSPLVYVTRAHEPLTVVYLRSTRAPQAVLTEARGILREFSRDIPMRSWTGPQLLDEMLGFWKLIASGMALFGFIATLFAVTGIHAVISFLVAQRTTELAIRSAIGAAPSRIAMLVVMDAVRLAGNGVVLGIPLSIAVAVVLRHLLLGLELLDVTTIVGTVLLLLAVGAAAALIPARRAATVDPMKALRS